MKSCIYSVFSVLVLYEEFIEIIGYREIINILSYLFKQQFVK